MKSVRAPLSSSAAGSSGPVIEMVSSSLLRSKRSSSYAPLSTEDPGPSRYRFLFSPNISPKIGISCIKFFLSDAEYGDGQFNFYCDI